MITKTDCYILLAELEKDGIDTKDALDKLSRSNNLPIDVIQFINQNRQLDLAMFYEKLRKNYNHKKSMLYKNIVKEVEDPNEVLTTLSSMLTQILLFSKQVNNKQMFLKHARCNEITLVLNNYFKTYDLTSCLRLLRMIKADLKCLESIKIA